MLHAKDAFTLHMATVSRVCYEFSVSTAAPWKPNKGRSSLCTAGGQAGGTSGAADWPGRDAVDADAKLAPLDCQAAREAVHGGLGGRCVRLARTAAVLNAGRQVASLSPPECQALLCLTRPRQHPGTFQQVHSSGADTSGCKPGQQAP